MYLMPRRLAGVCGVCNNWKMALAIFPATVTSAFVPSASTTLMKICRSWWPLTCLREKCAMRETRRDPALWNWRASQTWGRLTRYHALLTRYHARLSVSIGPMKIVSKATTEHGHDIRSNSVPNWMRYRVGQTCQKSMFPGNTFAWCENSSYISYE